MAPKREQDIQSFDVVFTQYYPRLCDYARSLVGDDQLAEDLVQDAFVVFLEHKDRISPQPLAIKAYLYSTVKFSCLNTFRRANVISRFVNYVKKQEVDENSFEDAIVFSEVLGKIHQALEKLPEGSATILKLGYLEGLKNDEIAEKLNISVHTVKSQKQRGIRLLREGLDPELFRAILFFFMN